MKYWLELRILVDGQEGDHDAHEYGEYLAIDLMESKKSVFSARVKDVEYIVE